jgi:hypothetical protein
VWWGLAAVFEVLVVGIGFGLVDEMVEAKKFLFLL